MTVFPAMAGAMSYSTLQLQLKSACNINIYTASVLLLLASLSKLVSAAGNAAILHERDPILGLQYRYLFCLAGILELQVALVGFTQRPIGFRTGLIAWVASIVTAYRLGLFWIGYQGHCRCLGDFTDALHIRPQTTDTAMKIILAYLLIGSYATLFWLWWQKRKSVSATALSGTSAPSPAP